MIQPMYGVEMEVPQGKLPGFYAQVVHQIGDQVRVVDRDQQLFIVDNQVECDKLIDILTHRNMLKETFNLWLLPTVTDQERLMDYGFISISEQFYAYADMVAFFELDRRAGDHQDRWAALQQMNEYILTAIHLENNEAFYMVDNTQVELIDGIAKAFHVIIHWK